MVKIKKTEPCTLNILPLCMATICPPGTCFASAKCFRVRSENTCSQFSWHCSIEFLLGGASFQKNLLLYLQSWICLFEFSQELHEIVLRGLEDLQQIFLSQHCIVRFVADVMHLLDRLDRSLTRLTK